MNEVMEKLGEFIDKSMDAMYEKGKRETINAVLEIIDAHLQATYNRLNTFDSPFVDEWTRCKKEVLALKGEQK